ncbi:MAG: MarR family transcriptional regulator [Candidatus Heimdallarchaeaceae archaeon]
MSFSLSSFDSEDVTCFDIIKATYALSDNELEVMMCIKHSQPTDIKTIAKIIPKDRATISRSIQRLMGIGFVKKTKINLDRGGFKYIYSGLSTKEMKGKLKELIHRIATRMDTAIDHLTEEKCQELYNGVVEKYNL